jgi:hypothetical protein
MNDGGKGSKQRPLSVTQQEYENRWDAIFGVTKDGTVPKELCVCGGTGECQCPPEKE